MKTFYKTKLITTASIVLALAVVYAGGLYLIVRKEAAVRAEIADVAQIVRTKDGLQSTLNLVAETEAGRTELAQYLASDENVGDTLGTIESAARAIGLTVLVRSATIAPAPSGLREARAEGKPGPAIDVADSIENLLITLELTGSSENLFKMLEVFEALPLHITVGQTSFEMGEAGLWNGTVMLSIRKIRS